MADRSPHSAHQVEVHRSSVRGVEAMTLASNRAFPRHSHDQFAIGIILSGAQESWSGVGQVKSFTGDVIMSNPREIHDGVPVRGCVRKWRTLYLDPALVMREATAEGIGELEIVRPSVRDPALAAHFGRLFDCVTSAHPSQLLTDELLLRMIMHAWSRHGLRVPRSVGPSPSVAKALAYLDAAPIAPVTLADLAELCGVSRFQLLRGFAREVGTTPHAYLVQRRVCLARRFLAAGQTIADAAFNAGFADQSHIIRAFTRQVGVTPGRYLAAMR